MGVRRPRPSRILFGLALFLPLTAAASDGKVGADCKAKGHALWGRVQVVDHFADLDVKVVQHFADLKVRWVEHFADGCGRWQRVEHFPDLKIRFVDHFADVEIQLVDHFEGLP